jgi:hypothetical protein
MTNQLAVAAIPLVSESLKPAGRDALTWITAGKFYRQNRIKISEKLYSNHSAYHRRLMTWSVHVPHGMIRGFLLIGVG